MARLARPTWIKDRVGVAELSDKLLMPSTTVAETFPRKQYDGDVGAQTAGTIYVAALALPKDEAITKLSAYATVIPTTPTNQWMGICNQSRVVQAVSADRTTTALGTGRNQFTLTSTYTPTDDELVYIFQCVAGVDGGTWRTFNGSGSFVTDTGDPKLVATSSTGQTTPPAVGATLGAFTVIANCPYYTADV